jgi:cysteine desulfurase
MMITKTNRDFLYKYITEKIHGIDINGPKLGKTMNRIPNNLNIMIGGVKNDILVNLLDSAHIYCSGGSACNSSSLEPSHVLTAIGLKKKQANSSIRLTIDKDFDTGATILFTRELQGLVNLIRQSYH